MQGAVTPSLSLDRAAGSRQTARFMAGQPQIDSCPAPVGEYADQAVEYVRRAVGMTLEYDSDTLPILDHYLRSEPVQKQATAVLIAVAGGAYFGEVVRRRLGGHWNAPPDDPSSWRLTLPGGLCFSPAALALAAIFRDETGDLDASFSGPAKLLEAVEQILERMGQVSEDEYYTLCGRLDTLEHVQAVLLATAAARKAEQEQTGH